MRVCLVYDCLYPHTVGGAERRLRALAARLAADGHEVTYLTLRQWDRGRRPDAPPGVRVVAAGPRLRLYGAPGQRRILPPLVFGAGVLAHLLIYRRRYDVVHTAAFPYFSLLAAGLARPLGRFTLVVDWYEVWSRAYWQDYLGRAAGTVGWLVQRLCARVPQRAFCFSVLHLRRLREEGFGGSVELLRGLYGPEEPLGQPQTEPAGEPVVLFAGRHIPEKRVPALVPALARAREQAPALRGELLGDGPEREEVLRSVAEHGLNDVIRVPGFVSAEEVTARMARALCVALPSRREGYGLVVVEAAARGTPSVVVKGEDNAATELIEPGINGFVSDSASPEDLAAAIVLVYNAGEPLRESTRRWFARYASELSLDSSVARVEAAYAPCTSG